MKGDYLVAGCQLHLILRKRSGIFMKVLYVSSEALPYMASGGLGDVAGSLPAALRKRLGEA